MSERLSYTDKLANYFTERPNVWIDGAQLSGVAGKYAWRSRVSDCRRLLGMDIDNRQRLVTQHNVACNGPRACICQPLRYTVSEYRYVPQQPSDPVQPHDVNQPTAGRLL